MSRDIKFRAWDAKRKLMITESMLTPRYVGFNGSVIRIDEGMECLGSNIMRTEEDVRLMQFTGLLDKNGVEIFEGDILKWDHGDHVLEVRWYRSGWGYFSKLFSRFGLPEGDTCESIHARGYAESSVIVGNIYENPELLGA